MKQDIINKTLLLLVTSPTDAAVAEALAAAAAKGQIELSARQIPKAIAAARRALTAAADYHRDVELGRAITRLNDLYRRALAVQDIKTAASVQKEFNKLLALYHVTMDPTAGNAEADVDARAELAEVRAHLAPFGTGDDSTAELARRLVAQLTRPPADDADDADHDTQDPTPT